MSELIEVNTSSLQEAYEHQVWMDDMVEEYSSIMKNNFWEVLPQLKVKSVVVSRWAYKIKHVANGSVEHFKARFLAKGFS